MRHRAFDRLSRTASCHRRPSCRRRPPRQAADSSTGAARPRTPPHRAAGTGGGTTNQTVACQSPGLETSLSKARWRLANRSMPTSEHCPLRMARIDRHQQHPPLRIAHPTAYPAAGLGLQQGGQNGSSIKLARVDGNGHGRRPFPWTKSHAEGFNQAY